MAGIRDSGCRLYCKCARVEGSISINCSFVIILPIRLKIAFFSCLQGNLCLCGGLSARVPLISIEHTIFQGLYAIRKVISVKNVINLSSFDKFLPVNNTK